ncbi:hypothetical protein DZB84_19920 [Bacillus sp. HNG]|uniref:DUF4097 family beta strand repeat-containing protein n=1 Tax=Bacillus sp. HNG TaxID=2293325 RepID=UPI000E2F7879|nr:DUF4097 family beta strand repeat-containing protein [Bacillus sp. HNG]RFB12063.1 hypothetical protein DZB84_19920 [Bacillus sp. HNG]
MRKIMYGALIFVLIGVLGVIITLNNSGVEAFTFSSVDVNEKQEVSSKGVSNIIIDSAVDVNVIPAKKDQIEVEFSGKVGKKSKALYKLNIDEVGDSVEITMEKKNKFQFMMFNFTRVSLNVEVPEKMYDLIQMNASSGDIAVEEIDAKEMTIETQSGDIEIMNSMIKGSLNLEASSGDVRVKDTTGNVIDIQTSSGDITATNNKAKEIELLTSSGDIESNNQTSKKMNINTSSGDIIIDAEEITGDISMEASSGDIDVSLVQIPDALEVDFKSSSGDGNATMEGMKFSEKSEHRILGEIGVGGYQITARTSSGDFKIR